MEFVKQFSFVGGKFLHQYDISIYVIINKRIKQPDNRARQGEESPCIQGQAAGETPGSASWRKVAQEIYC